MSMALFNFCFCLWFSVQLQEQHFTQLGCDGGLIAALVGIDKAINATSMLGSYFSVEGQREATHQVLNLVFGTLSTTFFR
jgi:hypothetical protein